MILKSGWIVNCFEELQGKSRGRRRKKSRDVGYKLTQDMV